MSFRSPCIGVCDSTQQEKCTGCGRTQKEVYKWPEIPVIFKRLIIKRIYYAGFISEDEIESRWPNEDFNL